MYSQYIHVFSIYTAYSIYMYVVYIYIYGRASTIIALGSEHTHPPTHPPTHPQKLTSAPTFGRRGRRRPVIICNFVPVKPVKPVN